MTRRTSGHTLGSVAVHSEIGSDPAAALVRDAPLPPAREAGFCFVATGFVFVATAALSGRVEDRQSCLSRRQTKLSVLHKRKCPPSPAGISFGRCVEGLERHLAADAEHARGLDLGDAISLRGRDVGAGVVEDGAVALQDRAL